MLIKSAELAKHGLQSPPLVTASCQQHQLYWTLLDTHYDSK